ncbi:MAG: cell wall hydrolase [Longimonas sp.]|uniref:hypothetical protein n=1 Tax=Longimonas sp. TaxID=2039626 RepID=UPI003974B5C2
MKTYTKIASTGIACASLAFIVTTGAPDLSAHTSSFTNSSETSTSPAGTDNASRELLAAAYGAPGGSADEVRPAIQHLPDVDDATLWLARAIFSETKKPHEQELVAWVVRNRVETEYRGQSTYRDVVLDRSQFSAFNYGSGKRSFYINLERDTPLDSWQQALHVAYYVRHADSAYRPFHISTRHFFSQVSMPYHQFPNWANQRQKVNPQWDITLDEWRFRFYANLS